jgi:hypothetical protein
MSRNGLQINTGFVYKLQAILDRIFGLFREIGLRLPEKILGVSKVDFGNFGDQINNLNLVFDYLGRQYKDEKSE